MKIIKLKQEENKYFLTLSSYPERYLDLPTGRILTTHLLRNGDLVALLTDSVIFIDRDEYEKIPTYILEYFLFEDIPYSQPFTSKKELVKFVTSHLNENEDINIEIRTEYKHYKLKTKGGVTNEI